MTLKIFFIYIPILLVFYFLHLYFGLKMEDKTEDSVKIKLKYKSASRDSVQIYYNLTWNSLSPRQKLPTITKNNGLIKEVEAKLPLRYTYSNLIVSFGDLDLTNIQQIEQVELFISGSKTIFSKNTLSYFIENNEDFNLSKDGEVVFMGDSLKKEIIFETKDLRPFIAKFGQVRVANITPTDLLYIILTILFFSLPCLLKNLSLSKLTFIRILINGKYLTILLLAVFIIINIGAIVFYTNNDVDNLVKLKEADSMFHNRVLNKKFEVFNYIEHEPEKNLLYNGDFKYQLMFWNKNADSTTIKLIKTPYGNGVRVSRTDGNGGDWSLKYAGRSILYYPNHTYKISFKCRVLEGLGIPFQIGWWVLDEYKNHTPAFLPKKITSLEDEWKLIEVKYRFREETENPVFFLNSLKNYSEVEIADIKLIDDNLDTSKAIYSR